MEQLFQKGRWAWLKVTVIAVVTLPMLAAFTFIIMTKDPRRLSFGIPWLVNLEYEAREGVTARATSDNPPAGGFSTEQ
ncbi:hypothetical protein [Sinorhizobium saheli]|uniref:hypothetical protein n=1 Tax=Sinorhizobium saheli TaxID=36856 RepID=UPI001296C8FE|nr:hypothetical protein [Sinorhizobium saheli]MQW86001.1 hypothetical protein [Sinorhizobium saheli]